MSEPFSTAITSQPLMKLGTQALVRGGAVVWIGPIGAPIEDAEFDGIILNPSDVERFKAALRTQEAGHGE